MAEIEKEVMDASDLEKDLFSKVQTNDYYTTVLKIKGLEHFPIGFYYFDKYMEDPNTIGNPVAMQKFYDDSNIFLFWSYGNSVDIKGPTVKELAMKTVESMGGEVESFILQRNFKYFPHVSSQGISFASFQFHFSLPSKNLLHSRPDIFHVSFKRMKMQYFHHRFILPFIKTGLVFSEILKMSEYCFHCL